MTTRPLVSRIPNVDGVTHRFVTTPRLTFHIAEYGTGSPLLLLHGWPQHWYAWRKVIPLLAADHRVICPDLRGFGWTEAPDDHFATKDFVDDVLSLLDTMGVTQPLVIGHDFGGRIGFQLGLHAPERVAGLVTLNALHPYGQIRRLLPSAWRSWWSIPVETRFIGRWFIRHVPAFTRMFLELGVPGQSLTALDREEFVQSVRQPQSALASERLWHTFAYREMIPSVLGKYRKVRLSVPTLLLNGTHDFALSARSLGGYEPYCDDLSIRMITGGGHFLAEQHPVLVADAIKDFVNQYNY